MLIFVATLCCQSPVLLLGQQPELQWREDFKHQSITHRPALEVNYSDAARTAFRVLGERYRLTGELRKPHRLVDDSGRPWLWMEMEDGDGQVYSTRHSRRPSRINLYRRGPYFCEVHWLDLQLATKEGRSAPLRGDLALYCYPEKILAEITWHGAAAFAARRMTVQGIAPKKFNCSAFASGTRQAFSFPLFGEEEPLPDSAFTLLEGKTPVRYDARKGCYVVGTVTSGSFQKEFYETPNRYETATFSLRNDAKPRKVYICHESVIGGAIVEGGVVLDKVGRPMPLVVQVSKNFAGEKEEKFYNPRDTPFSETFFPLYLRPGEQTTLTSLHLYQNWGRHMTKHWSSLGAWMDYFHSSTGVTETTCYVPFKFAGFGGVSIADFRAMSQETFWSGQPQHDNLAGHSFLSFHDGKNWQHSKYESTSYRSTGPNWYDIRLNYLSADGTIKVIADVWETPQEDELRSFFNVRYEVQKPLRIENAQANFRFLSMTSSIQGLRFTRLAASGTGDLPIDFSKAPFPVRGLTLPKQNAYLAIYGDHVRNRGSNAIIIREFTGPRRIGPAASLQVGPYQNRFARDGKRDTRLLLVPDVDRLELETGDVFEINGYWLPYGSRDNAETPRRETVTYGIDSPKVTSCKQGTVLSNLPVRIKASEDRAEFSITGGSDLIPVIVTGLSDWRHPRIWRKEKDRWRLLAHARNTDHDGYQVFCDEENTFGAVFLVGSDATEQTLKVSVGEVVGQGDKISAEMDASDVGMVPPAVALLGPKAADRLRLIYPRVDSSKGSIVKWKSSEGGSLWFKAAEGSRTSGGRVTPNQEDVDLEYWWQNDAKGASPRFMLDLKGTSFEDPKGERTRVLTAEGWRKIDATKGRVAGTGVVAVTSTDGKQILCMAWPKASGVVAGTDLKIGVTLQPARFPANRRYHIRGKIYLLDSDLEILKDRIGKEMSIF